MSEKLIEPFLRYIKLIRLDKPVGIFLLLWPTLWALLLAANGIPNIERLTVFCLGVVLMRSAGCIINDIIDKDFDKGVKRTSERMLASGDVSVQEAIILLVGILLLAASLLLSLNAFAIQLAFAAFALTVIYPFFKRFFPVPQVILGVAFGFGILMAYADTKEMIEPIAWILFIANFFWSLAYDTTYAMTDKEDDLALGLKSSAITFGQYDKIAVLLFQTVFLILMIAPISLMNFGYFYGLSWFFAAIYCYYLFKSLIEEEQSDYQDIFNKNHRIGAILFLGILFDLSV